MLQWWADFWMQTEKNLSVHLNMQKLTIIKIVIIPGKCPGIIFNIFFLRVMNKPDNGQNHFLYVM